MEPGKPLLVVVTGPTASGKTGLALRLAETFHCDIISADSRQIYREIPIGTAAPTADDLSRARHHFVGTLSLDTQYSAASFESDTLALLESLAPEPNHVAAIMCGGSMMYVDAVVNGIDEMPAISDAVRERVLSFITSKVSKPFLHGLR